MKSQWQFYCENVMTYGANHWTNVHARSILHERNPFLFVLMWVGIIRREPFDRIGAKAGEIRWPLSLPRRDIFLHYWRHETKFYRFRNNPEMIRRIPYRMLPNRWGFGFCGIEFGDRG